MFLSTIVPIRAWLLCSFSVIDFYFYVLICVSIFIPVALSYIHTLIPTLSLVCRIHMYTCRGLFRPNKNQRSISWRESMHQCLNIIRWLTAFKMSMQEEITLSENSHINTMELAFKLFQPEHHILPRPST